jgi:hypothetical protein
MWKEAVANLSKTTKAFSLRLRVQNYLAMEVLWTSNTQAESKTFGK